MKIKNLKVNPKACAIALSFALMMPQLSGCGKDTSNGDASYYYGTNDSSISYASISYEQEPQYVKAVIFNYADHIATVVEIKACYRNSNNDTLLRIVTKEGLTFTTSIFDTKFIYDTDSTIDIEDFIKCIGGDGMQINYLNGENQTYGRNR